ncbi:MAG: LysR family transcriptional regulator, partial [Gammaproteobacteria bacterium]|nr:LysR family transcriptional regulator [Gammaproteobacteria bacterium]
MTIELRHLHTLAVLRNAGSLTRAADHLHLTQSALSHQVKDLEESLGVRLFQRKSRPLRFTQAGERLLRLADRVLPAVQVAEREIARVAGGETGRLHIAIECHSCFEWLIPTMDAYRIDWPDVEMDLTVGFRVEPLPALARGDMDLVITSDPREIEGLVYRPLFRYEALLAMATHHPLTRREWIEPADLARETLITYPVERERLDVYRYFLEPAGVEPAGRRTTELTAMMLQLVASARGVAALPNWAMEQYLSRGYVTARPLGRDGMHGTLYAALRVSDSERPFMRAFLATARRVSFQTLRSIEPADSAGG